MSLRILVPNFSWVIPGKLAGSGAPARDDPQSIDRAYRLIYDEGVRLVVCLLERPPNVRALEAAGLNGIHFPVRDFATPMHVEAFAELIDEVHERVERAGASGMPTLVHCYFGIGRTGMFLASYLARHTNVGADAAVEALRRQRPHSIETSGQVSVVRLLAQ